MIELARLRAQVLQFRVKPVELYMPYERGDVEFFHVSAVAPLARQIYARESHGERRGISETYSVLVETDERNWRDARPNVDRILSDRSSERDNRRSIRTGDRSRARSKSACSVSGAASSSWSEREK